MDNSIPEPPPGHFVPRDSLLWFGFCCFVFNDVKSKTAEQPFFSLAVFYQYIVSNTDNFAGGESKKRLGKKRCFQLQKPSTWQEALTPASLQQAELKL